MRYFVTGGAGFIGSNYIEHLFQKVEGVTSVTIYDKFTYASCRRNYGSTAQDSRLRVIEGDICNGDLLERSMAGHDVVVHFAAESHVDRSISNPSVFIESNVNGTLNVLEASLKLGVKKVLHVSTDEVYGSLAEGSADETHILAPNSPYAASKASSDLIALSYYSTYGLDVRITRCCNNYGKHQYPEKIIPLFVRKLNSGEKIPIYGDGKNIREWIHVSDHTFALQLVIQNGQPGEIYNIGTGDFFSNNQLAEKILQLMGLDNDMKSYVADRKGHDFRYSLNSNKIQSLGFKASVGFDEGLMSTIEWYLLNSKWWDSEANRA
jgi:dTDP-glucose 4,6-dehydratase